MDGEVAERLRTCTVLGEDLGSVPSTHVGQLPTACSSSSRRLGALFWPPLALYPHLYIHSLQNEINALKMLYYSKCGVFRPKEMAQLAYC